MLAAWAGHVEAFYQLLERGSAIDVMDNERQTILHLAARGNHLQILQVNLHKADVTQNLYSC